VATFARSSEKQEFSKNMPKRIASDPTAFKKLGELIKEHEASGRTRSAAFLIWFLQTVYRLDTVAAQDSVCDRKADMGIDALMRRRRSERSRTFSSEAKGESASDAR